MQRNVWLTAGWNNCTRITSGTIGKGGIPPKHNHPWIMDTCYKKKCFTLVVDNFAIIYTNMDYAKHLINAPKECYTITVN
jgi:hypothetical protein